MKIEVAVLMAWRDEEIEMAHQTCRVKKANNPNKGDLYVQRREQRVVAVKEEFVTRKREINASVR